MTVHENINVTSPFFSSRCFQNIYFRKFLQNPENYKDITIKISMMVMNLKSLADYLVLWYGTNLIDDFEFILNYDYSHSTQIYLYQKYKQFKLQIFDEALFVPEFRFAERDFIPRLSEALQPSHKIVCCQETVANNIEALCILLLRRLSYLWRLSHMVPLLRRNPSEICDI